MKIVKTDFLNNDSCIKQEIIEVEVLIHENVEASPVITTTPESPTNVLNFTGKTEYIHSEDEDAEVKNVINESCDSFNSTANKQVGYITANGIKHVCNVCYKPFRRSYNLKRHVQVHSEVKKQYSCTFCNSTFARNYSLQRHLKVHAEVATVTTIVVEKLSNKNLVCKFCNYECLVESQLMKHMLGHEEEKPFSCEQCNYRCSRKDYLRRHAVVHCIDKPYKCNLCNYKCSDASSFRRHLKIHSGNKPLSCNLCNYKCFTGSHLKRHMVIHAKERFFCFSCSYKTLYKDMLKKHTLRCKKKKY